MKRGVSKRRVKVNRRMKKAQRSPDGRNGSDPSGVQNGYRPEQKQQEQPGDSPASSENICSAGPVLGYNGVN